MNGNFNQPNNSQLQPSFFGSVPASSDFSQALCALECESNMSRCLAVENERLQHQLALKQFREEAYAYFVENNGQTYALGRNGLPQLLMDTYVKSAFRFNLEPPFPNNPFYQIELERYGQLIIRETDFFSDMRLINAFQQHGVHINILRTQKNTANLLRQAINENFSVYTLRFYGGWEQEENNNIRYYLFDGFLSCQPKDGFLLRNLLSTPQRAVATTAINQFAPIFDIIRTPFMREMTILLYHEAALHTLLRALGYNFSLACCFFSMEQNILAYFRDLLSWFGSRPLTLDNAHSDFQIDLLSRKDQPLLIEDSGRLNQAAKNAELLESAIINRVVPWKKGREPQSLLLQAPITLLSSRASALNCAPEVILLDFGEEDFDRERWLEYADQVGQNRDYLAAFCGYTMEHIHDLRNALEEGQKTARQLDKGLLAEQWLQAVGIFIGLHRFLKRLSAGSALDSVLFPSSDTELFSQLLSLLVQTSEKAERTSLPKQFLEVARGLIQKDVLHTYPKDRCPVDMKNVVIFDDKWLCFTSEAFLEVCQAMVQPRPVIIRALSEADLFGGYPINKTTVQTRVTIHNAYGLSPTVPVYKLARESFETFGDPLILEEGDVQNGF